MEYFDVRAIRRSLACGDLYAGANDATFAGVVASLLRPVELAAVRIDGDSDAPSFLLKPVGAGSAGLHQCFNIRPSRVQRMTGMPSRSHQYAMEAVHKGADRDLANALITEAELFSLAADTEDKREGTRAFIERRLPCFKGI